ADPLHAEQVLDVVAGPGGAVRVRCDQFVLPPTAPALLPDPAAGHRLAVARRTGQQDAALGPAAVLLDLFEVGRLQVADGVLPQEVELLGRQDRRGIRTILGAAELEGQAVELAVVLAIDDGEVEAPAVLLVTERKADADEVHALDLVEAHAE